MEASTAVKTIERLLAVFRALPPGTARNDTANCIASLITALPLLMLDDSEREAFEAYVRIIQSELSQVEATVLENVVGCGLSSDPPTDKGPPSRRMLFKNRSGP
ncbi:hypothetical protein [Herbaspirillum sp. RV1423]|uniref:hypothetical protein n=1 Tax=Herbaspirillum sp. RV1423 TaxID=1443993 RepID=UPI0012DF6853|nr:hypothetical protein [Herbaspirillum sp. RV1423]